MMSTMLSVPVEKKKQQTFKEFFRDLRFWWLIRDSRRLTVINTLIVLCLFLSSELQWFAWKAKFAKTADVAAVSIQSRRMQISVGICLLGPILFPICHVLCICGRRGLMKLLNRLISFDYIPIVPIGLYISILFVFVICPAEEAQTLITNIFQEDYSLSHMPKSIIILECVTTVFSIQYLVLLVVLARCKPANFDFFEFDEVKADAAPTPADEKGEKKALLCDESSPQIQIPSHGEEKIQQETPVQL